MNSLRVPPQKTRREADIPPSHYRGLHYDHLGRFSSYWHQIEEITRGEPATILEVGTGTGMVSRYLRGNGFNVITLDINQNLVPEVVGDVRRLPFRDDAFDAVLCAEVLENMPFEDSAAALHELSRIGRGTVVITVPDRRPALRFHLGVSGIGDIEGFLSFPLSCPHRLLGADHVWELGKHGYPVKRLTRAMREAGLNPVRTLRILHNPTSRVFVCVAGSSGTYNRLPHEPSLSHS